MPTQTHTEEVTKDDGTTGQKLVVEFSNGSLQQLRDLAGVFNVPDGDPYKVIEMGIGLLESLKDKANTNPPVALNPITQHTHGRF